jgi:hypothetical protein
MSEKDEKTIPLGDDEQAVDVVLEEGQTPKAEAVKEGAQKASPETDSDEGDDELENYSENVKKRIGRMTFKVRETERREKAALDFARGLQKTLEEEQAKRRELDTAFIREYDNRLKLQEALVRSKLREAIDRGDAEGQIEANKELATISMEQERVRVTKQRLGMDGQPRQQPVQQRSPEPVQQVQQPVQQAARVDPRAQDWASRNKWFGADEPMTLTAFSIHKKLVEEEHFDPTSDDYYNELDKRMRREFPHKFKAEINGSDRPVQVVAGARPANTANPAGRKTLRLTPSQVAIAKKLNVPLDEYAKQLQKLNG